LYFPTEALALQAAEDLKALHEGIHAATEPTSSSDESRSATSMPPASSAPSLTTETRTSNAKGSGPTSRSVEDRRRKAAELYQKSADQGDATAQCNLGALYEYGDGVPKDLTKAAELYHQAAVQGDAAAQCNLGFLYANGSGVAKNLTMAAELYHQAADQGLARAQNNLGNLYKKGNGVAKDLN